MLIKFPIHYLFNCAPSPKGCNIAIDAYIAEEIMDWIGGQDHRDGEENNHHGGDFIWLTKDGKYTNLYCTYDASCRLEECFSPSSNKDHAFLALKAAMTKDKKLFFSHSLGYEDKYYLLKMRGVKLLEEDMFYDKHDKTHYLFEVVKADILALGICRLLMMWRESQRLSYRFKLFVEKITRKGI